MQTKKPLNAKLFLSIALLFFSLCAFAQPEVKPEEKPKNESKTETDNTKIKESKEKPCNPEDPKKPMIKKDLEPLTKEVALLKSELNDLKATLKGLPAVIDSQYTKVKEMEILYKGTLESNASLKKENETQSRLLAEEKQKAINAETAKNQLSKTEKDNYEAYDKMVNDYILHCKSPNNSTLDLMKAQLTKSGAYLNTISKIDEFKKQSNALQAAIKLLQTDVITDTEFSKARTTLANLNTNTEFLGLQETSKALKAEYERFIELGLNLEELIKSTEKITLPKFRPDKVYGDFKEYIYAIKPYPFLEKKFNEAQNNPNCTLGITLK
jgi:hypothetical protein